MWPLSIALEVESLIKQISKKPFFKFLWSYLDQFRVCLGSVFKTVVKKIKSIQKDSLSQLALHNSDDWAVKPIL